MKKHLSFRLILILIAAAAAGAAAWKLFYFFLVRWDGLERASNASFESILNYYSTLGIAVGLSIMSLMSGGLGLLLALRAWQRRDARLLAATFSFGAFVSGQTAFQTFSDSVLHASWDPWIRIASMLAFGLTIGALIRFAQLFPDQSLKQFHSPDRYKHGAGLRSSVNNLVVRTLFRPWFAWGLAALMMLLFGTSLLRFTLIRAIGVFTLAVAIAAMNLGATFRSTAGQSRQSIMWMLQALIAVSAILLVGSAARLAIIMMHFDLPLVGAYVWLLLIALAVGFVFVFFGIFYRGELDPALVVRRTAVVSTLTVVLIFLFAGVENLAADMIASRLGLSEGIGAWVAGGTVAICFGPLRDRIDRLAQRLLGPSTVVEPYLKAT